MRNGRGALWALLALSAIVLAAGLTWSVVRLAGEHIGLASAPVSVVHGLAPRPAANPGAPPERDVTRTVTATVTVTVPASGEGAGRTAPAVNTRAGVGGTGTATSQPTKQPTAAGGTTTGASGVTVTTPVVGTKTGRSEDRRERATYSGARDD